MFDELFRANLFDAFHAAFELTEALKASRIKKEKAYWDQLEKKVNVPPTRYIVLFDDEFLDVTMTPEEFARLESV